MDIWALGKVLLASIALAGHCVLWIGFINRLHAFHWRRKLVDALTFVCVLALVGLPLLWLREIAWLEDWVGNWPGWLNPAWSQVYLWLCAAVAIVAAAAHVYLLWHPEHDVPVLATKRGPIAWRHGQPHELLAKGLPRWLGTLPGNQTTRPEIVEIDLAIAGLPEELIGLRIAHLSDLHMSGRLTREYFAGIVDATNSLDADIVALTGDIVERTKCLDWLADPIDRLRAKLLRAFVLGNHDRKAGSQAIRQRLTERGWMDAGGGHHWLELRGARCLVVGNEHPWFPAPSAWDPSEGQAALRLALVHTPDLFYWADEHAFDLVLAGHNHGGQIRFPVVGPIVAPSRYGTRYASGLFRRGRTIMHVSPGSSSLAPLRWNCPPNVTLLTLYRGDRPSAAGKK